MNEFTKRIVNAVGDGIGFGLGILAVLKMWGSWIMDISLVKKGTFRVLNALRV